MLEGLLKAAGQMSVLLKELQEEGNDGGREHESKAQEQVDAIGAAMGLTAAVSQLSADLKDIKTDVRTERNWRRLLIVSLVFDILLTVVIGFLSVSNHTLNQKDSGTADEHLCLQAMPSVLMTSPDCGPLLWPTLILLPRSQRQLRFSRRTAFMKFIASTFQANRLRSDQLMNHDLDENFESLNASAEAAKAASLLNTTGITHKLVDTALAWVHRRWRNHHRRLWCVHPAPAASSASQPDADPPVITSHQIANLQQNV